MFINKGKGKKGKDFNANSLEELNGDQNPGGDPNEELTDEDDEVDLNVD